MKDRLMLIMAYNQVPTGPKIVELAEKFDTDPAVRGLVMAYLEAHRNSLEPNVEAATEKFRELRLEDMRSGSWPREMCYGEYQQLVYVRNVILKECDTDKGLNPRGVEIIRQEWQANPGVHEPLNRLLGAMTIAMLGYNIQLLAYRIQNLATELLEVMPLRGKQDVEDWRWDLGLVSTRGFHDGNNALLFYGKAAKKQMDQALPADCLLRDALMYDVQQVKKMAGSRMGHIEVASEAPTLVQPDDDGEPQVDIVLIETPGYTPTDSGLLVPEGPCIIVP